MLYLIPFMVALSAMILPIFVLYQNIHVKEFEDILLEDDRDWTVDGVLPSFVVADPVLFYVKILNLYF